MATFVCPLKSSTTSSAACDSRCALYVNDNCALRLLAIEYLTKPIQGESVYDADHSTGE